MKSIELEKKLHELNNGKYPSPNNEIVLYLAPDGSMGQSPNVPITEIREGFDWNEGLTLLVTKTPVMPQKKDRDNPRQAVRVTPSDGTGSYLECPCCGTHIWKGDKYCSNCGQRVDTDNTREVKV